MREPHWTFKKANEPYGKLGSTSSAFSSYNGTSTFGLRPRLVPPLFSILYSDHLRTRILVRVVAKGASVQSGLFPTIFILIMTRNKLNTC